MVSSERGQVLLIGGLAIAIVFMTAIPLSNSLVVTESASTSDTVVKIDQAAAREASVQRGLSALLAEVNTSDTATVNRSLRNFSASYSNVSGLQDGVYVNATVNMDETMGNYTSDELRSGPSMSSNYTRPDNSGPGSSNDWDLARSIDELALFNLTIRESSGGSMNAFRIVVTGGSGATRELTAVSTGPSSTEIRDGSGTTICSGSSVDIDLLRGDCDGAVDGTFPPITDGLDGPYTVRFENGNRADGLYTFASTGQFPGSSYSSTEYRPYAVQLAVDLTYIGPDVSYERTVLVNETS